MLTVLWYDENTRMQTMKYTKVMVWKHAVRLGII